MRLVEKLKYANETKNLVKQAIEEKVGNTISDRFRDYSDAIKQLDKLNNQEKVVDITENGGSEVFTDPGFTGMSRVIINTNVPTSGGGSCAAGVCFDKAGYDINEDCLVKMREDLNYTELKLNEWDPSRTSTNSLFNEDKKLAYAPKIDTSKVTDMAYMFQLCKKLIIIPQLDTSNVTNVSYMFYYCSSLASIPQLDTSKVTNMDSMFSGCSALTTIPLLNTINVTNMGGMFISCEELQTIPQLDTHNVTNMENMFNSCYRLKAVPQLDTSNVTNMQYIFSNCGELHTVSQLDTSNVTNMNGIFESCWQLYIIKGLSVKSLIENAEVVFNWNWGSEIFNLHYLLIKDLGTPQSVTSYDMKYFPNWGNEDNSDLPDFDFTGAQQALVDSLLTYSFDRKAAGYENCTIALHPNNQSKLTAEQITAIQNKGYTLTF